MTRRAGRTTSSSVTRDTDHLVGIDYVGVCDVVVRCENSPARTVTRGYPTECITPNDDINPITARAACLRCRVGAPHIQAQSHAQKEDSEQRRHTKLPYKTYST